MRMLDLKSLPLFLREGFVIRQFPDQFRHCGSKMLSEFIEGRFSILDGVMKDRRHKQLPVRDGAFRRQNGGDCDGMVDVG